MSPSTRFHDSCTGAWSILTISIAHAFSGLIPCTLRHKLNTFGEVQRCTLSRLWSTRSESLGQNRDHASSSARFASGVSPSLVCPDLIRVLCPLSAPSAEASACATEQSSTSDSNAKQVNGLPMHVLTTSTAAAAAVHTLTSGRWRGFVYRYCWACCSTAWYLPANQRV